MEYAYVYTVKERIRGDGKERRCERYNMKGKFCHMRRVERHEMFMSAWVVEDKE